MIYFGAFLIVYGILMLYLTLTKSALLFKNFKVKTIVKKLGEKNTFIVLLTLGLLCLVGGILLI